MGPFLGLAVGQCAIASSLERAARTIHLMEFCANEAPYLRFHVGLQRVLLYPIVQHVVPLPRPPKAMSLVLPRPAFSTGHVSWPLSGRLPPALPTCTSHCPVRGQLLVGAGIVRLCTQTLVAINFQSWPDRKTAALLFEAFGD
jgi:hypothetical protein